MRLSLFEIAEVSVLVVVIVLLVLCVPRPHDTAGIRRCPDRLSLIGFGLRSYHDEYGSFPPAFVADDDGIPMHSWRTLLMPWIDQQFLIDDYDFGEAWDSEANRTRYSVPLFMCPHDAKLQLRTDYLAVVGPHTAWPGTRPVSLNEITDPHDKTILLIEVVNSDVEWFEPRDLNWDSMRFRINEPDRLGPGSPHENSVMFGGDIPFTNVLMVDGRVKKLPVDTPPETLRALLTIDGGEKFDDPFLP